MTTGRQYCQPRQRPAAAGAPLELIARRPDIAAARERLIAADYRVAETIASAFPDIVLSATATGPSLQIGGAFQSANTVISSFVAEASQTFYGGRRPKGAPGARRGPDSMKPSPDYASTWLNAIAAVHEDLVRDDRQRTAR